MLCYVCQYCNTEMHLGLQSQDTAKKGGCNDRGRGNCSALTHGGMF